MNEVRVMDRLAESAFRRHYGEVYRYLLARTRNPDEAEELTQRVFADAVAAESKLSRDGRPILPWLLAVAHRRWVDDQRRKHRERGALDTTRERVEPDPADRYSDSALRDAVAELHASHRDVIARRLWRDLTFGEIGTELGITEGAVKMRFRRGLELLRELLEDESPS